MPMRRKLKQQGGFRKIDDIQKFEQEVNIPLIMDDFKEALKNVKPSVGTQDLHKYEEWMKEFGEQGTK
jgi:SpoVK/Ycf46/Vps4 family AAA+-type ATPase